MFYHGLLYSIARLQSLQNEVLLGVDIHCVVVVSLGEGVYCNLCTLPHALKLDIGSVTSMQVDVSRIPRTGRNLQTPTRSS